MTHAQRVFSPDDHFPQFDLQHRLDTMADGYGITPNAKDVPGIIDLFLERERRLLRNDVRLLWEGEGSNLLANSLLGTPEIRSALSISDNQFQQMLEMKKEYIYAPERRETLERTVSMVAIRDGEREEITETLMFLNADQLSEIMSFVFDNTLTSEQKQNKNEMLTAFIAEAPFLSENMFEALDLTDAQRQQMESIKKEFAPEFEAVLEEFVDKHMILLGKVLEESWKTGELVKGITIRGKQDIERRLMAEDPVYQRTLNEIQTGTNVFSTRFRTRLYDVLTDEQWKRLQDLINNPPEHVRIVLNKLRRQSGKVEEANGVWTPGPNSWRPGDPIPEEYRQERNKRTGRGFPRAEDF